MKIFEIDYAHSALDLTMPDDQILLHSKKIGTIDGEDVHKFISGEATLYFFSKGDKITVYILMSGDFLHGMRNRANIVGGITALIAFITGVLGKKVIFSSNEQLTSEGLQWLLRFLQRNSKRFTVVDQNGDYPDIDKIRAEWIYASSDAGHAGPTSITIMESNETYLKEHQNTLMPMILYIGNPNFY